MMYPNQLPWWQQLSAMQRGQVNPHGPVANVQAQTPLQPLPQGNVGAPGPVAHVDLMNDIVAQQQPPAMSNADKMKQLGGMMSQGASDAPPPPAAMQVGGGGGPVDITPYLRQSLMAKRQLPQGGFLGRAYGLGL